MSDRIVLGQNRWGWGPDPVDLSTPDPAVPTFSETLDELAARLRRQIGTVRRTRDLEDAHPRILKLLEADEQRRVRLRESPYLTSDPPVFDSTFEQRRLRLLNSLLRALDRVGVNVSIEDREARTVVAYVADYSVSFTLDVAPKAVAHNTQKKSRMELLRCQLMSLGGGTEAIESWTETDDQRLEAQLADIAVAIVVHAERICRGSAHHYREYVIKRKGDLVEEQRRKEEERQRLERERLERLENARVARLLSQARALKDAQEIRAYVATVQDLQPTLENPLSETDRASGLGCLVTEPGNPHRSRSQWQL